MISTKKILTVTFLIYAFFITSIFAAPKYKMEIKEAINDNNAVEINVYIQSEDDTTFELTSYQCALSLNQSLDFSKYNFTYVAGSSELVNEPDLYVGIDNLDGENELTFVSYIGDDKISSSKKTLVGKFLLTGENIGKVSDINLQWNFEGTVSTIITGNHFENITNPSSHVSDYEKVAPQQPQTAQKINITSSVASAVTEGQFYPEDLYDGITSSSNGGQYSNSSPGRWAVAGFPQWVTLDLGEETQVDNIKIDGFESEKGVTYDCEFYRGNYDNKELIKKETTQSGTQWSEHDLGGVKTRYLTVVITGSEGNNWCDIWEMEVNGISSTSDVTTKEAIPSEYSISQNYPNPFNPTTKVEVSMKESGTASLDVFNILGERVLSVMNNEELSAGNHEVNINAAGLPSGTYIYRINIDNKFTQVKKMNLLK